MNNDHLTDTQRLEQRIAWLEAKMKQFDDRFPVTPEPPIWPCNPQQPIEYNKAMCPVCQLDSEKMTGYVCTNSDCPGRVWCGTSSITSNYDR